MLECQEPDAWTRWVGTHSPIQGHGHKRRESISAVMRAFMLEHEIEHKQELTSLEESPYCSEDIAGR
jgi:hypothetical protein